LVRISDADLDVITDPNSGAWIQFSPLDEEATDGAEGSGSFIFPQPVKRFKDCAVEITGAEIGSSIPNLRLSRGKADLMVCEIGGFHQRIDSN
jgi:hypothetical protein